MDSIRYGAGSSRYDGFHSGLNSKQSSPLRQNQFSYNNTARLRQSLNIQRLNLPILNHSSKADDDDNDNSTTLHRGNNSCLDGRLKKRVTSPNTYCNTQKNYDYHVFGSPETIDVVQKHQSRQFEQVEEDCYLEIEQEQIQLDAKRKRSLQRNSCDKQDYDLESHQIPNQFQSKSPNKEMLQDQEKSTAIDTDRNKCQSYNRSISAAENIKQALKYPPSSVPNRSNQQFISLRNKSSTPFMFGAKKERSMILIERSLNQSNNPNNKFQSSSKISTGAMDIDIQMQNERKRTQSQYFIGNHNSISSEQMVLDVFS